MALGCLLAGECPGERQAGPPRRSDGSGLGVAFACAVGRCALMWLGGCAVGAFRDAFAEF